MKRMGAEVTDLGWKSTLPYDFVSFARAVRRCREVVRSVHPDVIHLHSYFAEQAIHLAYPFSALPVIVTIATDSPTFVSKKLRHRFRDYLRGRLYRRKSTHLVSVSSGLADTIRARMRLGEKHVEYIWNGLSSDWFENGGTAERDIDVLVVGRADENKNHIVIVRALAELKARGKEFRAVLAGDGPKLAGIRAEVEKLCLTEMVSCPGMVENPQGLFRRAKIVACPSKYEGFPITPIEGMACGCVLVCSDIPSHREILGGGRYGILIASSEPQGWPDAIGALLDDAGRREAISMEGSSWARESFAFEPLARRYLNLYEEMHGSARR